MNVIITNFEETENYKSYEAICGKKEAHIYISKTNKTINVTCKNAAHKVWRGLGNSFETLQDALSHYKTSEMKSIIQYIEAI